MEIAIASPQFSDWAALLDLLSSSYAYMTPRIDPPSSLASIGVAELQAKAQREQLIVALEASRILGCAYAAVREDCVYVSKLAVDESARRRGIARKIFEAVEGIARANAKPYLELETRIELIENHATFAALGFAIVEERSHAGFERPTIVVMRKPLGAGCNPS
jgi:GNAT superfamily N-acetyltransferase